MKQVKTLQPMVIYTRKVGKDKPVNTTKSQPSGNGVATFWQSHTYHG